MCRLLFININILRPDEIVAILQQSQRSHIIFRRDQALIVYKNVYILTKIKPENIQCNILCVI